MDIWLPVIIFLALFSGWLIGRYSKSRPSNTNQADLNSCSEHYIQGLNYLLANKSDKAIELFVELVKVDRDTIETHLALGNLFRSKGEVDRAIKIHQNLIARPNLDQGQRVMALSELAEDYQKAGLLDRAENLYKELVQINPQNALAHRQLLQLYSMEKSWQEARASAQVLLELNEPDARLILSHCYCELAQQLLNSGNLRMAREQLGLALQTDSQCTRASLLLIEVHLKNNEINKATKLFDQLLEVNSHQIELLIPAARELLLNRGSTREYQRFLLRQYEKMPVSPLAVELLESYLSGDQHEELHVFIKQALKQSASLDVFEFAMRYFKANPQYLDDTWPDLTSQFKQIKNKRVAYSCNHCGYGSQTLFWNCPSCKSWASLKPVH
jgi:lipopolysaccharide assembly protein B